MSSVSLMGTTCTSQKEKRTLMLPVPPSVVPEIDAVTSFALENGFTKKEETHVTLIGFTQGQQLLDAGVSDSIWEAFLKFVQEHTFIFEPSTLLYLLNKQYEKKDGAQKVTEQRSSIIQLLQMSGDTFYEEASKILGVPVSNSLPHVTLYFKSSDPAQTQGIGISRVSDLVSLQATRLTLVSKPINAILLPTRPQADTLVALFLLKQFGETQYPGVASATVHFNQQDIESKDWMKHEAEGTLLLDIGGGPLDHHSHGDELCLSEIVAKYFGQTDNKAIKKLVQFARRDDVDGQGTLSEDPLDRAFGLSGLIVSLNRVYQDDPNRVYDIITPVIEAHYKEQVKRTEELPKLFTTLLKEGKAEKTTAVHRGKKINIALFTSDDPSLASYLRSFAGGNFDAVIQIKSSGHVNILTHTNRRPDLRSLAVVIRKAELMLTQVPTEIPTEKLAETGRLDAVPQWYFDLATNSLQNGGVNPGKIAPTQIPVSKILNLVKIGLEESMWKPKP